MRINKKKKKINKKKKKFSLLDLTDFHHCKFFSKKTHSTNINIYNKRYIDKKNSLKKLPIKVSIDNSILSSY